MKAPLLIIAGAAVFVTAAAPCLAQSYVYPAKGQSASRQSKDEAECSRWASNQTGFDPTVAPPPPVQAETKVTGSGARAAGALGGAAIAGIAGGNAATGAVVGAVGGGVIKRIKNKNTASKQTEANNQQYAARRASFDQARAACLSGRGYTVR